MHFLPGFRLRQVLINCRLSRGKESEIGHGLGIEPGTLVPHLQALQTICCKLRFHLSWY